MEKIVTRFAPSPTGYLQLGNVRTALYNFLYAKKHHGQFILRIEDTDPKRSKKEYTDAIKTDLNWLGTPFDQIEIQSENTTQYDPLYQTLIDQKKAYYCSCSAQRLDELKQQQIQKKQPPRYDGHCQGQFQKPITPSLLRFKMPNKTTLEFRDQTGNITQFNTKHLGDFVIKRADNTPVFLFSNAIDDHQAGITHVIRGNDHLSNTPKQLLILQALGKNLPCYTHIPLVLNLDGTPLSKRQNDLHLQSLRVLGYTPQAIQNYLIRLGHQVESSQLLTLDDMINTFDLKKLSHSAAKFDNKQLQFWQQQYLQTLDEKTFIHWATLSNIQPKKPFGQWLSIVKENITTFSDVKHWHNLLFDQHASFTPEHITTLKDAGEAFFKTLLSGLENNQYQADNFESLLNFAKQNTDKKGKQLFLPLRLAITRNAHGPALGDILPLFDALMLKARFEDCLALLS